MTITRRGTPRARGSLLMLTLLVSAALVFFSMAFFSLYHGNRFIQMQAEARLIAEAAASGGIEDAIHELKKDAAWKTGFNATRLAHSGATYSMTFSEGASGLPWSTNNIAGSGSVTGCSGRVVPAYTAHLVCMGRSGNVVVTEEVLVSRSASFPFKFGVFGSDAIQLRRGVTTDSYNSSAGPYSATKLAIGGDIATNATRAGAITLVGRNTTVRGDVTVGPGGDNAVVAGRGTYHALQVPLSPVPVTPPTAPSGESQGDVRIRDDVTLAPGVYGNLSIEKKATVTLISGTYVFTDIDTKGKDIAIAVGSGPVTVYFTGTLDLGKDSAVNVAGNPSALTFLGTASAEKVHLGENSQGAFSLFAPAAAITVARNSVIYGAVAGRNVNLQARTAVHFDQALLGGSGGGGTGPWKILSRW